MFFRAHKMTILVPPEKAPRPLEMRLEVSPKVVNVPQNEAPHIIVDS